MLEENKKLVKDVTNRVGTSVQDLRDLVVRELLCSDQMCPQS